MECLNSTLNNSLPNNSITLNKTKNITLIKGWRNKRFNLDVTTESKTFTLLSEDLKNYEKNESLIEELELLNLENQPLIVSSDHYKKISRMMKNDLNSEFIIKLGEKLNIDRQEEFNNKFSCDEVNNNSSVTIKDIDDINYEGSKPFVSNWDKMLRKSPKKERLNEFFSETVQEFLSTDMPNLGPTSGILSSQCDDKSESTLTRTASECGSVSSCGSGYIYVPKIRVRTSNIVKISDKCGRKPKTLLEKRLLLEGIQNENGSMENNCSRKHIRYVERNKKFNSSFRTKYGGRMFKSKVVNLALSSKVSTSNRKNVRTLRLLNNCKFHPLNKMIQGVKFSGRKNSRINKNISKKSINKKLKNRTKNFKSILKNPVCSYEEPLLRILPDNIVEQLRMYCKDIYCVDNFKNNPQVMVLTLGLGRPLCQEQVNNINFLRKNNCVIDAAYASFAVSTVLDRSDPKQKTAFPVPVVCPTLISLIKSCGHETDSYQNKINHNNSVVSVKSKHFGANKVKNREVVNNLVSEVKFDICKDKLDLTKTTLPFPSSTISSDSDVKNKGTLQPKSRLFNPPNIYSKKSKRSSDNTEIVSQVIEDVISSSRSMYDTDVAEKVISEVTAQSQANDEINKNSLAEQNGIPVKDYSTFFDISSQKSVNGSFTRISDIYDKTTECKIFSAPSLDTKAISPSISATSQSISESPTGKKFNYKFSSRVRCGDPSRKVALELKRLNSVFLKAQDDNSYINGGMKEDSSGSIAVSSVKVSQENMTDLIPDDSKSKLARVEKDYHRAVMKSNNGEMVFVSPYTDRTARKKTLPKKFQDVVLLDDSEVLKPFKVAKKKKYKSLDIDEIDNIVHRQTKPGETLYCKGIGNDSLNETKADKVIIMTKDEIPVDKIKPNEVDSTYKLEKEGKNHKNKETNVIDNGFYNSSIKSNVNKESDFVNQVLDSDVEKEKNKMCSKENSKTGTKLLTKSINSKSENGVLSVSNVVENSDNADKTKLVIPKMKGRVSRELESIMEMSQKSKLCEIYSESNVRTLRSTVRNNKRSQIGLSKLRGVDTGKKIIAENSDPFENGVVDHNISLFKSKSDQVGNLDDKKVLSNKTLTDDGICQNISRSSNGIIENNVPVERKPIQDKAMNSFSNLDSNICQELKLQSDKLITSAKFGESKKQNLKENTVLVETSRSILKPSYLRNNFVKSHFNSKLIQPLYNPCVKIEKMKWCFKHNKQNCLCQKFPKLEKNVAKKRTFALSSCGSGCVEGGSKSGISANKSDNFFRKENPKVLHPKYYHCSDINDDVKDLTLAQTSHRPFVSKNLLQFSNNCVKKSGLTKRVKTNRNCNPLEGIEHDDTNDFNNKKEDLIYESVDQVNQLPRIESVMTIRPEEFFTDDRCSVESHTDSVAKSSNTFQDVSENYGKPCGPIAEKQTELCNDHDSNSFRFFCISLKYKFSFVRYTGSPDKDVCISYKKIMEFIGAAQIENKCTHRALKKLCNESSSINSNVSFGIYIVPLVKFVIFFGPYGVGEPHQLEAFTSLMGTEVVSASDFSTLTFKPVPFVVPSSAALKEVNGIEGRWWYVDSKRACNESIASILNSVTFQHEFSSEPLEKSVLNTDKVKPTLLTHVHEAFIPLTPANSLLIQNQMNVNIIKNKINLQNVISVKKPEKCRSILNFNNTAVNKQPTSPCKNFEFVPRNLNAAVGAVETLLTKTASIGSTNLNDKSIVSNCDKIKMIDNHHLCDKNVSVTPEKPTVTPKCFAPLTQYSCSVHKADGDSSNVFPVLCSNLKTSMKEDGTLIVDDKHGGMKILVNVLPDGSYIVPTSLHQSNDSKGENNLIYVFKPTPANSTVNAINSGLMTCARSGINTCVVNTLQIPNSGIVFPLNGNANVKTALNTTKSRRARARRSVDSLCAVRNTGVPSPTKVDPSKVLETKSGVNRLNKTVLGIKKIIKIPFNADSMKSGQLKGKSYKRKRPSLEPKVKTTKKSKSSSSVNISGDSSSNIVNLVISDDEHLTPSLSSSPDLPVLKPILSDVKSFDRIESNDSNDKPKDEHCSQRVPLLISPPLLLNESPCVQAVHSDKQFSLLAEKYDHASASPKVATVASAPPVLLNAPRTEDHLSCIVTNPAQPTDVNLMMENFEREWQFSLHLINPDTDTPKEVPKSVLLCSIPGIGYVALLSRRDHSIIIEDPRNEEGALKFQNLEDTITWLNEYLEMNFIFSSIMPRPRWDIITNDNIIGKLQPFNKSLIGRKVCVTDKGYYQFDDADSDSPFENVEHFDVKSVKLWLQQILTKDNFSDVNCDDSVLDSIIAREKKLLEIQERRLKLDKEELQLERKSLIEKKRKLYADLGVTVPIGSRQRLLTEKHSEYLKLFENQWNTSLKQELVEEVDGVLCNEESSDESVIILDEDDEVKIKVEEWPQLFIKEERNTNEVLMLNELESNDNEAEIQGSQQSNGLGHNDLNSEMNKVGSSNRQSKCLEIMKPRHHDETNVGRRITKTKKRLLRNKNCYKNNVAVQKRKVELMENRANEIKGKYKRLSERKESVSIFVNSQKSKIIEKLNFAKQESTRVKSVIVNIGKEDIDVSISPSQSPVKNTRRMEDHSNSGAELSVIKKEVSENRLNELNLSSTQINHDKEDYGTLFVNCNRRNTFKNTVIEKPQPRSGTEIGKRNSSCEIRTSSSRNIESFSKGFVPPMVKSSQNKNQISKTEGNVQHIEFDRQGDILKSINSTTVHSHQQNISKRCSCKTESSNTLSSTGSDNVTVQNQKQFDIKQQKLLKHKIQSNFACPSCSNHSKGRSITLQHGSEQLKATRNSEVQCNLSDVPYSADSSCNKCTLPEQVSHFEDDVIILRGKISKSTSTYDCYHTLESNLTVPANNEVTIEKNILKIPKLNQTTEEIRNIDQRLRLNQPKLSLTKELNECEFYVQTTDSNPSTSTALNKNGNSFNFAKCNFSNVLSLSSVWENTECVNRVGTSETHRKSKISSKITFSGYRNNSSENDLEISKDRLAMNSLLNPILNIKNDEDDGDQNFDIKNIVTNTLPVNRFEQRNSSSQKFIEDASGCLVIVSDSDEEECHPNPTERPQCSSNNVSSSHKETETALNDSFDSRCNLKQRKTNIRGTYDLILDNGMVIDVTPDDVRRLYKIRNDSSKNRGNIIHKNRLKIDDSLLNSNSDSAITNSLASSPCTNSGDLQVSSHSFDRENIIVASDHLRLSENTNVTEDNSDRVFENPLISLTSASNTVGFSNHLPTTKNILTKPDDSKKLCEISSNSSMVYKSNSQIVNVKLINNPKCAAGSSTSSDCENSGDINDLNKLSNQENTHIFKDSIKGCSEKDVVSPVHVSADIDFNKGLSAKETEIPENYSLIPSSVLKDFPEASTPSKKSLIKLDVKMCKIPNDSNKRTNQLQVDDSIINKNNGCYSSIVIPSSSCTNSVDSQSGKKLLNRESTVLVSENFSRLSDSTNISKLNFDQKSDDNSAFPIQAASDANFSEGSLTTGNALKFHSELKLLEKKEEDFIEKCSIIDSNILQGSPKSSATSMETITACSPTNFEGNLKNNATIPNLPISNAIVPFLPTNTLSNCFESSTNHYRNSSFIKNNEQKNVSSKNSKQIACANSNIISPVSLNDTCLNESHPKTSFSPAVALSIDNGNKQLKNDVDTGTSGVSAAMCGLMCSDSSIVVHVNSDSNKSCSDKSAASENYNQIRKPIKIPAGVVVHKSLSHKSGKNHELSIEYNNKLCLDGNKKGRPTRSILKTREKFLNKNSFDIEPPIKQPVVINSVELVTTNSSEQPVMSPGSHLAEQPININSAYTCTTVSNEQRPNVNSDPNSELIILDEDTYQLPEIDKNLKVPQNTAIISCSKVISNFNSLIHPPSDGKNTLKLFKMPFKNVDGSSVAIHHQNSAASKEPDSSKLVRVVNNSCQAKKIDKSIKPRERPILPKLFPGMSNRIEIIHIYAPVLPNASSGSDLNSENATEPSDISKPSTSATSDNPAVGNLNSELSAPLALSETSVNKTVTNRTTVEKPNIPKISDLKSFIAENNCKVLGCLDSNVDISGSTILESFKKALNALKLNTPGKSFFPALDTSNNTQEGLSISNSLVLNKLSSSSNVKTCTVVSGNSCSSNETGDSSSMTKPNTTTIIGKKRISSPTEVVSHPETYKKRCVKKLKNYDHATEKRKINKIMEFKR